MNVDDPTADPPLGLALLGLGAVLAANALLGPLAADVIRYRFSRTLILQGIGLDLVSLAVVAPICLALGLRALRGRAGTAALALGPAAYAAYMAVQYVVGPEYLELPGNNERFFAFHLGLFVLALVTAVRAWTTVLPSDLPELSGRRGRRWGAALLGLAALLVLRYLPAVLDLAGGSPTLAAYRENPTSYFLIATMDLGLVAPACVAAGLGLRRGRIWARKAVCGIVGWFGLVGPAVAAMSATMWLEGDPDASAGQAAAFGVAGAALLGLALFLLGPLIRERG